MATGTSEALTYRQADYTLHVFAGNTPVGELVQNPLEGSFSLNYAPDWTASGLGFPHQARPPSAASWKTCCPRAMRSMTSRAWRPSPKATSSA
jgi:hypothetical protein